MVLDHAGRIKRSHKASNVSAKNRAAANKSRDRLILLAYKYLTRENLTKLEKMKAIRFLQEGGNGVNLPENGIGPLLFISRATGLTKQRIFQIIKKNRLAQFTHQITI